MVLMLSNLLIALPMACFQALMMEWLNKKGMDKRRVGMLCAAFLIFLTVFTPMTEGKRIWNSVAEAVFMILLSLIFYKGDKKERVLAAAKLWLFVQMLHGAAWIFLALVRMGLNPAQEPYLSAMLRQNIYNLLLYILFVAAKIYTERKNRQKFILLAFVSCFFAVAQLIFYYYLFFSNPGTLTGQIIGLIGICSVIILFVHSATLELMGRMVENQKRQNETERKMLEKKYEYDYYLLAQEQTEAIQKIRSDMWNQLKIVQELMQGKEEARKEAEDILGRMEEEVSHIGRVYYCDDAVLNTILSLKQEKARKLGIAMDIKVDSTVKTEAEDIDLCCIVTNLLDNAIESAEKVLSNGKKEEGEEDILVRVGHRGGYLVMKVENAALSAPVKNKKGGYKTSKENADASKDHGRGLNIVEKTAKKYGGHLDMKKEGSRFRATVFLKEKME